MTVYDRCLEGALKKSLSFSVVVVISLVSRFILARLVWPSTPFLTISFGALVVHPVMNDVIAESVHESQGTPFFLGCHGPDANAIDRSSMSCTHLLWFRITVCLLKSKDLCHVCAHGRVWWLD